MSTRRGYAVGHIRDVDFGPDIKRYMETIESTFVPFGGSWVVHGAAPEVVEGEWEGDLVIIGFPSVDDARAWYFSRGYQAISKLRENNSTSSIVLLEGVPPGYQAIDTVAKLERS